MIVATHGAVAAERIEHLHHHEAPPPPVSWPVLVGQIPGPASALQDRPALRGHIDGARSGGQGVVLTQVLSGGGGVGKSQLAASYAREALATGTDLVVWVDAGQPVAVTEAFARAARAVQAPAAAGEDAEADAREFLAWAATTSRSWLVVLDDITDPAQLVGWWPASPTGTGWVLATTRRRDAALTGMGRALIDVGVYTPGEAHTYLARRLEDARLAGLADGQAGELAAELGYLPLALSHAAAYMIDQQVTCSTYLARYTAGLERLDELMPVSADADEYGRPVAVTLLLALDTADRCDPAGLARPAIQLAALFDPAGHPATLWATDAVTAYLSAQRAAAVTPAQARAAVLLLHRFGLATFDDQAGPRAVRVHALTGRAAREATPTDQTGLIAIAGADALLEIWPDPDWAAPVLTEALRANGIVLARHAKEALWYPDGHLVLYEIGESLSRAGLYAAAASYWQRAAADAERILGTEHPVTLFVRAGLADSTGQAGNPAGARDLYAALLPVLERVRGPGNPSTLAARGQLASWTGEAGDPAAARDQYAALLPVLERVLGPEDRSTLAARQNLADRTGDAGNRAAARDQYAGLLPLLKRVLGPEDPDTLSAHQNLASWTGMAGDATAARDQYAALLLDVERVFGPDHPKTLTVRGNLANWTGEAGNRAAARDQYAAARDQFAALLPDFEGVFGPDHPSTLNIRRNLAFWTGVAGDPAAARDQLAALLPTEERILHPGHPRTLTTRRHLANMTGMAGDPATARDLLAALLPDMARVLGPEFPETQFARSELYFWTQNAERGGR
jgi:hypothetical protein